MSRKKNKERMGIAWQWVNLLYLLAMPLSLPFPRKRIIAPAWKLIT